MKWIPTTVSWDNFARLFKSQTELFGISMPLALRWLFNSVFISVVAMALTCITSSLAGYALAKKRFWGRGVVFTLFVCAMALPKQVILIPLLTGDVHPGPGQDCVGLPLRRDLPGGGLALRRVPDEAVLRGHPLSRCWRPPASTAPASSRPSSIVALPIIKPGIGALAIFTFISAWNEYSMQLVMLSQQ